MNRNFKLEPAPSTNGATMDRLPVKKISKGSWIGLLLLLVLPALAWCCLPDVAYWPVVLFVAMVNGATYLTYAHDKKQAVKQLGRVPENGLHLLELAGGWPGGFLAQRRLRHKSSKRSYLFIFWLIVMLHQMVSLDFLMDWKLARSAGAILSSASARIFR